MAIVLGTAEGWMLLVISKSLSGLSHVFLGEEENEIKEMDKKGRKRRLKLFWFGGNEKMKDDFYLFIYLFGRNEKRKETKIGFLGMYQFLLHINS